MGGPSERWPWGANCCGIASRADWCQRLESKERRVERERNSYSGCILEDQGGKMIKDLL